MASNEPITIAADVQERLSGVPDLLARIASIRVVTATLPCADYTLGNALGVERKAAKDLGRSIIDGRLFQQLGALRRSFRRPLLLVEGLRDGAAVGGVPWPAVRGALVSASTCFGVPVLRTTDAQDSASLIAMAARQLREPFDIPYVRPGYRPAGWRKRALYILQGLPDVGSQRARALLERFGSVAGVVTADFAALTGIPGIGNTAARAIHDAVGEERHELDTNAAQASIRSPSTTVTGTDS